jgi:hypothetical protein
MLKGFKLEVRTGRRYVNSPEDHRQQVLDGLQSDVEKFHPLKVVE